MTSTGGRFVGLAAALLVSLAPLQTAEHHLEVTHTWCDTHGHLIELETRPTGASPARPLPYSSLRDLAGEQDEVGCTSLSHERRSTLGFVRAAAERPPVVRSTGAPPAPLPALLLLDHAPKRGPPSRV
ncbi:MAG: hypothetical protein P1V51_14520 [Deltaproteobacteria bacterium]|nr:hypothetical protein [Deltaproteobacteria bacterium]